MPDSIPIPASARVPTNAYRVYTVKGRQRLAYIAANGQVIDLTPDDRVAELADGYYTRDFQLIRLSRKPRGA